MKNELTIDEARLALKDLEATRSRARNTVFAEFAAPPLMLWGLIWAFCHLNGYLYLHQGRDVFGRHPDATAQWVTWVGLALTFAFIILKLRFLNPIRSEGTFFSKYRAPLLTVAWFAFHAFTSELHQFESGRQMNAYYSMYWMLLFIVYGFWLGSGLFLSVGVLVCCCAVIGYQFLPEHYSLVMGLGAGGTLFVGGLFSLIRCRRAESDGVAFENE
ncbi:MAG: hypothetical protein JXR40_10625 [Pontiellaceae bacterium]|nr:hypothetical protein [Pontiellaceae bacterium]